MNSVASSIASLSSLSAGITYLTRTQHPAGYWTDFWLPVGTSDAWVTAYIGLALSAAAACPDLDPVMQAIAANSAKRAADWLVKERGDRPGWGYNATVPPDADSTAHALSLLAKMGLEPPIVATTFLQKHLIPREGFQTYRFQDAAHQWTRSCSDVTAAALRALFDVGALTTHELQQAWCELLQDEQDDRGWWHGAWWVTPNYTTGLVLEVWQQAGCPALQQSVDPVLPTETAFDLAWALHSQIMAQNSSFLVAGLIKRQAQDGGWLSAPILKVPPSHPQPQETRLAIIATDARRLFTTATAVRTLALACQQPEFKASPNRASQIQSVEAFDAIAINHERSAIGQQLDQLITQSAQAIGFPAGQAESARALFALLTQASLASPCPFPSAQLSSLAGGMPLEFSATIGNAVPPALRYAVEVGNPFLSSYERARSAITAIANTATHLGYTDAWQQILPAIEQLVSSAVSVPEGRRFCVWGGIDQLASTPDNCNSAAGLKLYLNLLNLELGNTRQRLESALQAANIPVSSQLRSVLDTLDEVGFLHEMGFGIGAGGKLACKIYYELHGWRRSLMQHLLNQTELPAEVAMLCPAIPGLLRESLAAKSRSGIAVRIASDTGTVRELTTATAFPPPLLTHLETQQRVEGWIKQQAWDATAYQALTQLLLPAWETQTAANGIFHSLMTRTVSATKHWSTIYLRPYYLMPIS